MFMYVKISFTCIETSSKLNTEIGKAGGRGLHDQEVEPIPGSGQSEWGAISE